MISIYSAQVIYYHGEGELLSDYNVTYTWSSVWISAPLLRRDTTRITCPSLQAALSLFCRATITL